MLGVNCHIESKLTVLTIVLLPLLKKRVVSGLDASVIPEQNIHRPLKRDIEIALEKLMLHNSLLYTFSDSSPELKKNRINIKRTSRRHRSSHNPGSCK
jgi:hypothetical protein